MAWRLTRRSIAVKEDEGKEGNASSQLFRSDSSYTQRLWRQVADVSTPVSPRLIVCLRPTHYTIVAGSRTVHAFANSSQPENVISTPDMNAIGYMVGVSSAGIVDQFCCPCWY
jgi:hypothetical protein